MRILLTGHKGYIGAVAGPVLRAAGHKVVGLDTDLFAGCEFGEPAPEIPEIRKDIRDLTESDLEGFDAPEIARQVGIPVNTVYSRLRVGRAEFQAAVEQLQSKGDAS